MDHTFLRAASLLTVAVSAAVWHNRANRDRYLPLVLVVFGLSIISTPCRAEDRTSAEDLPEPPNGYHWQLNPELSDEFNGHQLDASKWQPSISYWKGREPSQFVQDNVSVYHGKLQLASTVLEAISGAKDRSSENWIGSACVSSIRPIASYGYYEARIKASDLSMTSSFWFQSHNSGDNQELDVVEQFGAPLIKRDLKWFMLMDAHYSTNAKEVNGHRPMKWRMPTQAAATYHVYGVWWKDTRTAVFYHDGHEVARLNLPGEFRNTMYMFFDTEAFATFGLPSVASLKDHNKNRMYVDWVRSWKLVKDESR